MANKDLKDIPEFSRESYDDDDVPVWDKNSHNLRPVSSSTFASNHNLLSSTHTDTTSGSPAKGDLIVASSSSWQKLAVGANKTTPIVDSSKPLGLEHKSIYYPSEWTTWTHKNPMVLFPDGLTFPTTVIAGGAREMPCVVTCDDLSTKKFYMFMVHAPGTYYIKRQESTTNPISGFGSEITCSFSPGQSWYVNGLWSFWAVYEGGGNMKAWADGFDAAWNGGIGYFYSSDYGATWTAHASNPIVASAPWPNSHTLKPFKIPGVAGTQYYCFISIPQLSEIRAGHMTDEVTLSTWGTGIIEAGSGFESSRPDYYAPYFDSGIWYIIYGGYNGSVWQAGLASAAGTPYQVFTKFYNNPISSSSYYGFDVVKVGEKFYVLASNPSVGSIVGQELSY